MVKFWIGKGYSIDISHWSKLRAGETAEHCREAKKNYKNRQFLRVCKKYLFWRLWRKAFWVMKCYSTMAIKWKVTLLNIMKCINDNILWKCPICCLIRCLLVIQTGEKKKKQLWISIYLNTLNSTFNSFHLVKKKLCLHSRRPLHPMMMISVYLWLW